MWSKKWVIESDIWVWIEAGFHLLCDHCKFPNHSSCPSSVKWEELHLLHNTIYEKWEKWDQETLILINPKTLTIC